MTQLAAVSPAELQQAQSGVLEHCAARINKLEAELRETEANIDRAVHSKYAVRPFRNLAAKIRRKLTYYRKVAAAVSKGYLIIPDVWSADCFAVRVKSKDQVRWSYGRPVPARLPVGDGEWVDHNSIEHTRTFTDDDGNSRSVVVGHEADDEIDFPVSAIKPVVLEATDIAMADKIFDTLHIARRGDPFILGTIKGENYSELTFFVAWFLDLNEV